MAGIAKFGDVLVNFIFSAAKLKATGEYDGVKVTNHVLMNALNLSDVPSPTRMDKHQKGDYVESIVAEAYERYYSVDDLVDILYQAISGLSFSSRQESIDTQIVAFTVLLNEIEKHRTKSAQ